jgi:LysM repeat protein
MKLASRNHRIPRPGFVAVSLMLVLAVLAAAVPLRGGAALAASCDLTHVVKEGETTGQIAHRYDMKWSEIAKENSLKPPYELEAGQQLCIPTGDDDEPKAATKAVISVTVAGGHVFITVDKFSARSVLTLKARAANVGVGGWSKLGTIKVDKNEKLSTVFSLPSTLRDDTYINVCLKNVTTDELTCRTTVNIR